MYLTPKPLKQRQTLPARFVHELKLYGCRNVSALRRLLKRDVRNRDNYNPSIYQMYCTL